MDWRRGCAELMLLRGGLCDTASSWWFFRAMDADKVVLTAVGHLPMWGRRPPSPFAVRGGCQARKSNCEASRSRARIEKFAPARKSRGGANTANLPDVCEYLAEFNSRPTL